MCFLVFAYVWLSSLSSFSNALVVVMFGRKSLSLVKELIETCLVESDGSIQLHAAKVFYLLDPFMIRFSV